MSQYTQLILSEIKNRAALIPNKIVSSIYFGGGTPSLLPAQDILTIRSALANAGFEILPSAEITIEINPGTITRKSLDLYLAAGVNRFSVGVQTFEDSFLKHAGREHSAKTTHETLTFLSDNAMNFSCDLLFGLPHQSIPQLKTDLSTLMQFSPPHVSLYNLTVPAAHFMNVSRASDEEQSEMFSVIDSTLAQFNITRYEVSNFAKAGFESKHNLLYWSDAPYWGLGISAHSYFPTWGRWGTRFWNPTSSEQYAKQAPAEISGTLQDFLPKRQIEALNLNEALTDFCHTQLRVLRGLTVLALHQKFGKNLAALVLARLEKLLSRELLNKTPAGYRLSRSGLSLANQVFLELTFLPKDIEDFDALTLA